MLSKMSPPLMLSLHFALYIIAAMAQLCAVHLARDKVLGDVPILAIGWASPKLGNEHLSKWVDKQENLRILRIRVPVDLVSNSESEAASYALLFSIIVASQTYR